MKIYFIDNAFKIQIFYFFVLSGASRNEENFKLSIKCKKCVFNIALFEFCSFLYCFIDDKNAFILDGYLNKAIILLFVFPENKKQTQNVE
ncbi:hypothetical protein CQ022_07010 [Chryseobacterium culicis]|uniref:Uncharacterized protein n=1 Tax=Chryseobacterium culicis TaxID=680127 RepID=A0A2S9CZP1_CHRCI|nr:hypothetical protein CQ022_07010 [Chryseobacterium culicis]PRB91745.1 hypothetical protein CQ033_00680 [Chryseobacterium culicis]